MTASTPRGPVPSRAPLYKDFRPYEVVDDNGMAHHVRKYKAFPGRDLVEFETTCGVADEVTRWAFRYRVPGSPVPACPICFYHLPNEVL